VNVGTDRNTAAFAVESLRRWWKVRGRLDYPRTNRLLVTADSGGANSADSRLFKMGLADFADECGLSITVMHFPPGTQCRCLKVHRVRGDRLAVRPLFPVCIRGLEYRSECGWERSRSG
jgi:hypothetical protein